MKTFTFNVPALLIYKIEAKTEEEDASSYEGAEED